MDSFYNIIFPFKSCKDYLIKYWVILGNYRGRFRVSSYCNNYWEKD